MSHLLLRHGSVRSRQQDAGFALSKLNALNMQYLIKNQEAGTNRSERSVDSFDADCGSCRAHTATGLPQSRRISLSSVSRGAANTSKVRGVEY